MLTDLLKRLAQKIKKTVEVEQKDDADVPVLPGMTMVMPPKLVAIDGENYVLGFDVSHHQNRIHFESMSAVGYQFVFLKATEGRTHTDSKFHQYVGQARTAGLLVGAYHFARLQRVESISVIGSAYKQAKHFARQLRQLKQEGSLLRMLPPVLDVEWHDTLKEGNFRPEEVVVFIHAFAECIKQELGVGIIVYTGPSFFKQYIKTPLPDYKLWLVSGYNKRLYPKVAIKGWKASFYQFTNEQPIPYDSKLSSPKIDANVYYGTIEDLANLLFTVV